MNALANFVNDSATLFRREMRRSIHYLPMTLSGLLTPTIMLLLFVFVFGGAMKAGLPGLVGSYIDYAAPSIIIMAIASGCASTAVNLCVDLNEGIITRFRSMAIAPGSVLTGQVLGSVVRTIVSVIIVTGVACLLGFHPRAGALGWLAALGLVAMFTFSVTWLAVVFGIVGKTVAGANSLALIFLMLSFTSSAFTSPDTMPTGLAVFVRYQPFTAVIDTLRGLLGGVDPGSSPGLAIAWSLGIAVVGYLWARAAYKSSVAR